jgi:pentatricopeptide repeat protein
LVYNDMCREGVTLDDTVFVAALGACAHGGLLQEGWSIFNQMVEYCRIVPRMEHYGCIVDLLGRAGKLQEAVRFIESMPLKPGAFLEYLKCFLRQRNLCFLGSIVGFSIAFR